MAKASDNAYPSILVTEGTVPASPAAGKQRLYIDSTTHKLKRVNSSGTATDVESAGGGATFVGVKAYRSAALNINATTVTPIPWDAEDYDITGFHDNVTNNTRLTVPSSQAGKYLLTCSAGMVAGFTANRLFIQAQVNGSAIRGAQAEVAWSNTSTYPALSICTVLDLAVADYVEVAIYQDTGGARAMYVATASNGISLTKLG